MPIALSELYRRLLVGRCEEGVLPVLDPKTYLGLSVGVPPDLLVIKMELTKFVDKLVAQGRGLNAHVDPHLVLMLSLIHI